MIRAVAVDHYRSLRRLRLSLGRLNVITGPNGSGKSNVYRALRLLADGAHNGIGMALAREGGLASAMWAGPQQQVSRSSPVSLRLGYGGDDFGYAVDLGLPVPTPLSMFDRDPELKVEAVWGGPVLRPGTVMLERRGPVVRTRAEGRSWQLLHDRLRPFDSVLSEVADFERAPEVIHVREEIRAWRFYDQFRTDPASPARAAQVGTRTPVLDNDGAGLAAAWQTILEIGDGDGLNAAVGNAFAGCRVHVDQRGGWFELWFRQPGLSRPLAAAELSDGTLRFLMLAAALLSPRPPAMLVLNEPETSLHPDLLPALAALISRSARTTQIVLVSHSTPLIDSLANTGDVDVNLVQLYRDDDGTQVEGQRPLDEPAWHFPDR
jgi:predicted ATPase